MLTVQEKIDLGYVCTIYANNELRGGKVHGGDLDRSLPILLYLVTNGLEMLYEADSVNEDLTPIGNYLISICRHQARAQAALDIGGSGEIPSLSLEIENIYPFIIRSGDFESDGVSYNNEDIVGDNLTIFVNEFVQQWLTAPQYFTYTATGIILNSTYFNANTDTLTIMVQRLNS